MEPEELKSFLAKGTVLIVQITPLTNNDEIDVEGLRENTQFLVEKSKHGPLVLVPLGSTGEFYALNEEERKKVAEIVVDEVNGKIPVIIGASAAGTKIAVEYSKHAEEIGADGVMIVLPYYHIPEEEGMYQHYKRIAEAINIGVLIYNNPDVSKVYILPHLMKKIAEIPNIVGVKENTPSVVTFYKQVKAAGDKIPILQGRGESWFIQTVVVGARGFISGYANFAPELSLDLLKAGLNNDLRTARQILEKFILLDEELAVELSKKYGPSTSFLPTPYLPSYMFMSVFKAAMDIVGLHGGHVRLPLSHISDEDKNKLKKLLKEIGIEKVK